ncbi:MAG: glycosyltransferase family 2 protein [Clostridiales bacterium]
MYNPKEDVLENIKSYLHSVKIVYVIDNSENINVELVGRIKALDRIKYFWNRQNMGIASALNKACQNAIDDGYDWILTMDQDSKVKTDTVEKLIACIKNIDSKKVSIISAFYTTYFLKKPEEGALKYEDIVFAITSGSLINLYIYKKIGPFMEELFIDEVDREYCYRSVEKGFKIIKVNYAIIEHSLGDYSKHKLFGKIFIPTNHNYIRRYYITRNRLYVWRKYRRNKKFNSDMKITLKYSIKEFILIILYETDKLKKTCSIIKGVLDFLRGKSGKYY